MKCSKIFYMVLAGSALVAGTQAAGTATTAAASTPVVKRPATAQHVISGTVASVDVIGNTLLVKAKKAEDTLDVDSTTIIQANGKKVAFGDLKSDARVTVSYTIVDGKKVVSKITIRPAAVPSKATPKDSTKNQSK